MMLQSTKQIILPTLLVATFFVLATVGPASPAQAQDKLVWHDFENALAIADSTGRPVFMDVWAPWCGWCRKMKRDVYPQVETTLNQNFVLTRLNRDDNSRQHQYQNRKLSSMKLAQRLRTQSVPAMVLLDDNGNYLLHLSGFTEAENLQPVLQYIGSGEYKSMQFDEFKNSSGS